MAVEVEKKIERFKEKKRQNCKEYILEQAEIEVDSTMYLKIGNTLDGTIEVPEKPMRPSDSLNYKVELDTGDVLDFLPDSIDIDSLK
jgi:hypothetical protein